MQSCQTLKVDLEVRHAAHVGSSLGLVNADSFRQINGLFARHTGQYGTWLSCQVADWSTRLIAGQIATRPGQA